MSTGTQSPVISRRLPVTLLVIVGLIPLAFFLLNPWQPLLEHHAFRQTQTAITVYWLMHGGPLVRYLTPVLGYPWTMPLEFPLFQWLVAFICTHSGMPLDFTGRLLSLIFFYMIFAPIFVCLRRYGWPVLLVAIALYVTAPTDLFFSRTFLIETFATLLALSALCSYILFQRTAKWQYLCAFAVLGTLAGLQKITTFLPVAGICGLDSVRTQIHPLLQGRWRTLDVRAPFTIMLSMALPLVWTFYSDAAKHAGVLSQFLTSAALWDWNFGTLAQHLQLGSWRQIFITRVLLGGGLVMMVPTICYAAFKKQLAFNREAGLFLFSGLLGPLVFFNLNYVHDYYQLGSIVFLACAMAIVMAPCLQAWWAESRAYVAAVLGAIVLANLGLFYLTYGSVIFGIPVPDAIAYNVALYLKAHQPQADFSVIIGEDWNSTIPYYSQRYAVMIPPWVPDGMRAAIVHDPEAYAGGRRIGSVVYCDTGDRSAAAVQQEREQLFSLFEGGVAQVANCMVKVRDGG
jgi:hypothetical protein